MPAAFQGAQCEVWGSEVAASIGTCSVRLAEGGADAGGDGDRPADGDTVWLSGRGAKGTRYKCSHKCRHWYRYKRGLISVGVESAGTLWSNPVRGDRVRFETGRRWNRYSKLALGGLGETWTERVCVVWESEDAVIYGRRETRTKSQQRIEMVSWTAKMLTGQKPVIWPPERRL